CGCAVIVGAAAGGMALPEPPGEPHPVAATSTSVQRQTFSKVLLAFAPDLHDCLRFSKKVPNIEVGVSSLSTDSLELCGSPTRYKVNGATVNLYSSGIQILDKRNGQGDLAPRNR